MELSHKIVEVFNEHDIALVSIEEDESYCILEFDGYSPLGENLVFSIRCNGTESDFLTQFKCYAYDFDADEHAKFWIERMGEVESVPCSVSSLLEDALRIKDTLITISKKLHGEWVKLTNEDRRRNVLIELKEKLSEALDYEPCGCDSEEELEIWKGITELNDMLYDYL